MLRNKEMVQNFENMRAIIHSFKKQVAWGSIGGNKKLTERLQETFYRHKAKGILDHFEDEFQRNNNETFEGYEYFHLKDNLSASQINDLHQFVCDFATILIDYLDVKEVRWYIKFASCERAPGNPDFTFDTVEQLKPFLEGMLDLSKKALLGSVESSARMFDETSRSEDGASLQTGAVMRMKGIGSTQ